MALPPSNDAPDAGRRTMLKGGAATVAGAATASYGWLSHGTGTAKDSRPAPSADPTPYLEPFLDPLVIPPIKTPTLL